MRRVGFVVVVVSIFAFGSLPSGAGQKPNTYTPVPLVVTMNACGGPLVPEICGDGGDPDVDGNTTYTDGQDGVTANIDQYGNVIINFQTTRAKMRALVYKYGSVTPAPPGGGSNHYFSTIRQESGPGLQTMPLNVPVNLRSCPLYVDDAGQYQYRHGFSRDCQSGSGDEGSPLVVTKTSPTTWEIEPAAPAAARVFRVTTTGRLQVQSFSPLMDLPFKMTLTAKQ
jgi:hypothetical protein